MDKNREVESVWDYPRPPRLERTSSRVRIVHGAIVLADSTNALRVLETSHPPVFYVPPADIAMNLLQRSSSRDSFCEFKGLASYWNINLKPREDGQTATFFLRDAAWSYSKPSPAYRELQDHLAFYASRVEECTVDGERVLAQPGDFYGGWITSRIKGPFKGAAGTLGW